MLKFRWLIIIALLVALLGTASSVFADDIPGSQENPQVALETFSGIALLELLFEFIRLYYPARPER